MIIGICGKSGSGKSTLSKFIMADVSNAMHLDIDKISHNVLNVAEVKQNLRNNYGNSIFEDNVINRRKLSKIVFNSKIEMKKLTDITWKYMQDEIDKILLENGDKLIILDWLLLPKTKYFEMCDIKVLLDISYEVRRERAMKRDNINEETFILREKASFNYDVNCFNYVIKEKNEEQYKRLVKLI